MAERLAGDNVALALLANAIATGAGLAVLILMFGTVSGAHFNPVVTLSEAWQHNMPASEVLPYIAVQVGGAFAGVAAAHLMFGDPVFFASEHLRAGAAQWWSEFVATFGLVAVIIGCSRSRPAITPFAVAAYISAAYWLTSSTSFANPAVTLARSASNTCQGSPRDAAVAVTVALPMKIAAATRERDRECAAKPRLLPSAAHLARIGIPSTILLTAMRLSTVSAIAGLLLAAFASSSQAADTLPLHTELTLTHVAADKWRADYVFAEPVTALDFGQQIGPYRKQAWRPVTVGVILVADGENEGLRSTGKPLRALSIEIDAYSAFAEGQYAPIDRFSDGGSDFYLGFLFASLKQGERERGMEVSLHLQGLPGETVITPANPGKEMAGYAYFGPAKPVRAGIVNVIIDPQTPAWLREVLLDTTSRVSQFYEQAFQRKLLATPLVSVAVAGFEGGASKLSSKGGVVGGGIVYRLEGGALLASSPKRRQYIARLIAHEMAHLWQQNLRQGGIGEDGEPWVHEGGAEAIMLTALRETGILTPEDTDLYAQGLLNECEKLKDDVRIYRGMYACGFKRFHGYMVAPIPLWKSMMASSESNGAVYSEKMIQALLKDVSTKP